MMAGGGVEGAGFWLPSEFLTDDDFLMDKENFNKANATESDSEFCFPTEFPYHLETQTDHLLEKFWMMSTSPQSTLAHHLGSAGVSNNGSPNSFPSPPMTLLGAKYDAVGDLIYLAAGEVAKLRLNRGYVDKCLSVPPKSHAQFHAEERIHIPSVYRNTHFLQKQQDEGCGMLYNRQQMCQNRVGTAVEGLGQTAWTIRQNPTRGRSVLLGGSGVGGGGGGPAAAKRTCAGTGVFLPRRYDNIGNNAYSSDSQRKAGRAPVQVHTKNLNNLNGLTQSDSQAQPRIINRGIAPDYYALLARRHALLLQQRRRSLLASLAEGSSIMGRDLHLPRDWNL